MTSRSAPSTGSGNLSPSSRYGTRPATCATGVKPSAAWRPEEADMTKLIHALALALVLLPGASLSKPLTYALPDETAQLRPGHGPGYEAAQNNCMACHSVDYINTQPPGRGAGFWQAEVTKMIKVYHAQIGDADAKLI